MFGRPNNAVISCDRVRIAVLVVVVDAGGSRVLVRTVLSDVRAIKHGGGTGRKSDVLHGDELDECEGKSCESARMVIRERVERYVIVIDIHTSYRSYKSTERT